MFDFDKLRNAMADLEEDLVLETMREVMSEGGSDAAKALEACQQGMEAVGNRFEAGEYFVGDLIYAGDVMTEALNIIKPALSEGGSGSAGKMILCTVKNDLHDIGKNIVKAMLEAGGLEVVDLGIDVAPETIVQTAKEQNISIIGLSGVLTLAIDSMRDTIECFKAAGIRDDVKIIIGGNPITDEACRLLGADDWALSPQKTVNVCKAWATA